VAALWAGDLENPGGVREAAEAARAAPPGPEPPRLVDVLLDALALRLTDGYAAAAAALAGALDLFLAPGVDTGEAGRSLILERVLIGLELWDAESWAAPVARQVQFDRDTGAVVHLQFGLNLLAWTYLVAGELTAAAELYEENRVIAEVTGIAPVAYTEIMLAAWRGYEAPASELIEATSRAATAGGMGRMSTSPATRARCSTTARVATTTRERPPRERSSTTTWGWDPFSCPSWPRRRRGPVTSPWSGTHSSGCPNAPA